jgi:hypothetical protein
MQVYLASDLYDSQKPGDADEFIERGTIPVEEAYQMAHAGSIRDGKTLAALFLASSRLAPGAA